MIRRPSHRLLLAVLAAAPATLAIAPSAVAQAAGEVAERRLLALERRLLAEDLAELREARAAEAAAAQLVDDVVAGLDAAVAAGAPTPSLAAVEASAAEAATTLPAAAHRVDRALAALSERLRRVRLLAAGAGAAGEEAVADVLSGRWAVEVEPVDVSGAFVLDQVGTLVTGSYQLDDGSRGSLEGTYVGDLLRLRRIDVASGFDSVFEARVDPAAQRMEGRWQATILGRGGAGGGEWVAVRVPPGAALVPEDEVEPGPAGPVDAEPVVEEEPLEPEPIEEPPAASQASGQEQERLASDGLEEA